MDAGGESGGIWIATVSGADAEGQLRERYAQYRGEPGFMIRALSLWPEALAAREDLVRVIFRASIGRRRRELVLVVCAALVGCDYCTFQHGTVLLRLGLDEEQVAQLKRDYRQVELEPGERAMLDYAAVLTVAPWRIEESHVQAMRDAGFDDRSILEVNQVCTLMNLLGRANRGLGVDAAQARDRSHEPDAMVLRHAIVAGEAP